MQNQLYHIQTSQLAPARRLPHRELRRGPLPSHHDPCPLQPGGCGWVTLSTHIYTLSTHIYISTRQTELLLDTKLSAHQSLVVAAPAPGHWYTELAADRQCGRGGEVEVAARAEYSLAAGAVTIVPSFHNYQDIRTLVTVTTTSLFRSGCYMRKHTNKSLFTTN